MSVALLLIIIALLLAIFSAVGVTARYPLLAISVVLLCIALLFGVL